MPTPGITDPFSDSFLDSMDTGGGDVGYFPPSQESMDQLMEPESGWTNPLNQPDIPLSEKTTGKKLKNKDIITDPNASITDTYNAFGMTDPDLPIGGITGTMTPIIKVENTPEGLGLVPAGFTFQGPFSSQKYNQIHKQESLIKTSGGVDKGNFYKYPSKYGIRSRFPRSSPKYTRYVTQGHREFLETTARMYISVSNPKAFVNEVGRAGGDQHLTGIAQVLAGNSKSETSGRGYIDFLLQQASHSLNEKVQVIETLSDNYVAFFFGQSAPVFKYSGSLMNTFQDDWTINMLRMFQSISRGSQLARRGVLFYLKYDSLTVSGSLLNFNWALNGENEMIVPFSFDMLVRKIHIIYGGLEPATNFMLDETLDPASTSGSFWPVGYDPNESGHVALNGGVQDDVGGEQPYGTNASLLVSNEAAPKTSPEGEVKAPPIAEATPGAIAAEDVETMGMDWSTSANM